MRAERTGAGIAMMCVGVACLSANDAFAKVLSDDYPAVQILFLRNALALPVAAAIAWRLGGLAALRSRKPMAHLLRGAIWVAAAALFFTALGSLDLAEATTLIFAAPLLITLISALVLGERVGRWRWSAVLAGFLGVLVILRPGAEAFRPVALLPLGTAFFYAVLMLSARWIPEDESAWTMMLYLIGAGGLVSLGLALSVWVPVASGDWSLFAGIAFFGTAGITLMTQAFRIAPASAVAPFDYTALIWATALGWAIWSEIPDAATALGAAVITLGGLVILWRERKPPA